MQNVVNNTNYQCRINISTNGRINIPSQLRKLANLEDGDELILTLKDNVIQLQPLDKIVSEVQDLVAHYFNNDDLMNDLNDMRKLEAVSESKKLEGK